jgi:hypothetical protein
MSTPVSEMLSRLARGERFTPVGEVAFGFILFTTTSAVVITTSGWAKGGQYCPCEPNALPL